MNGSLCKTLFCSLMYLLYFLFLLLIGSMVYGSEFSGNKFSNSRSHTWIWILCYWESRSYAVLHLSHPLSDRIDRNNSFIKLQKTIAATRLRSDGSQLLQRPAVTAGNPFSTYIERVKVCFCLEVLVNSNALFAPKKFSLCSKVCGYN
jgi:hypothetical protein